MRRSASRASPSTWCCGATRTAPCTRSRTAARIAAPASRSAGTSADRVACWYHGVEVGGDGVIAAVPAVEKSSLVGKCAVKRYPAKEAHGAIFVYFGDAKHPEAPPLEFPEQLASAEWSSFLCTAHWKCNYRYAIENVMDPMHGTYLHAQSHSMAQGDRTAEFRIRSTDSGLVFEKVNQVGVNFDWVEWGESGAQWMRLSIPYQKKFGPGGAFYIVGFATPVDAENTMVFFWRCRKVQGWQRDVWRFLYRNRLEGLHWAGARAGPRAPREPRARGAHPRVALPARCRHGAGAPAARSQGALAAPGLE